MAVACVCASCSSAGHGPVPQASPRSTTVPAPTSTTEPPPKYPPSPYSWERSGSAALNVGGGAGTTVAAVISPTVSQPWMAVGTRLSAAGVPTATVWTSPDGVSWTAAPIAAGGMASSARAAAQYRGQTVVVGSVGAGANQQAAAWVSPSPGAAFSPVAVPVTAGPSSMSLVAAGALGMFATGTVDGRFALWSTADGRSFGEQPAAEKTLTSTPGARVSTLMAEGDVVYAAGSVDAGPKPAAAVWSSSDGLHWHAIRTAANSFAGPGGRVIYSLAPLGTGLVAVGAVNPGSGWVPASWVSPDGASWSLPSTDFPGSPPRPATPAGAGVYGEAGGSAVRSVSAVPTFAGSAAVVAAGGGATGQAAWRSTDGLHWSPVGLPAAVAASTGWRATVAAGTINTTVVVDGDPGQAHLLTDTAAGWSQPSANPGVFGPVQPYARPVSLRVSGGRLLLTVELTTDPQAIGSPSTTVRTLASADGTSWSAVPAGTGSPASLPTPGALARRVPSGWAAVGTTSTGRLEAWSSPDGRAWTPAGLLPVATAAAPAGTVPAVGGLCGPAGSTAPASELAAVGSVPQPASASSGTGPTGRTAAAWVSPAGATTWKRATVSPSPAAGGTETMTGCSAAGGGLVAWGSSTGTGGASVPAVWRSSNGASWTRSDVAAFTPGSAGPLTSLALAGRDWLAVARLRTAAGPAATLESGQVTLWLSPDGGSTWQQVDTATPPWLGTGSSAVCLVAFAGRTPVLAGTVDGRLAVWTGAPVQTGGGSGGSTTSSG